MHELRCQHPYEFFTRGNTIRANVESVKRRRWVYEPRYTDFQLPGAVQDWLDVEFAQEVRVLGLSVRRCGLFGLAPNCVGYCAASLHARLAIIL